MECVNGCLRVMVVVKAIYKFANLVIGLWCVMKWGKKLGEHQEVEWEMVS